MRSGPLRRLTGPGSDTLGDVAWYMDNSGDGGGSFLSGGKAHQVKTKDPNAKGIYDMTGNVYEWCWDTYSTSSSNRVLRGGSWSNSASECAVSSRYSNIPSSWYYYFGFRVVRKAN